MLNEYKFSKYNHKISLDGNIYMYNALSGGFCKFDDDVKSTIDNIDFTNDKQINDLHVLPMEIIDGMKKGGFILNKDLDEFSLIKSKHFIARYADTNSLGLTLIPTLACNFRCTYCFEAGNQYPNIQMSEDVMDAVLKLIEDKLNINGNLNISWFGGEPLLSFDVIEKMQVKILEIVERKKLNFGSAIITNGYLLSKEISDKLVALKINFAQITIDGPKEIHDQKRVLINGQGTFDVLVNNILKANENLNISIRVNVQKDNISMLENFIDYLVNIGIGKSKNIKVYFAVVKDYSAVNSSISSNCFSVKEFAKEEVALNKIAYQKGLNINYRINPNITVCGSLSPKSLVIEPDGKIQKCWETVGDDEKSVGNLLLPNTSTPKNVKNLSQWYAWSDFDSVKCRECNILPICMGGCPLHSLNEQSIKDSSNYQCHAYKYNLNSVLELIALKHNI